jgi:uncharacterized membrane protein YphA (DoxX/SURF4 family)
MVDQSRSVATAVSLLAEFVGGLLVGFGLLGATPGGAAAIGLTLFVLFCTYLGRGFWNRKGEFEFPLSVVGAMVPLALTVARPASPFGAGPLVGLAIAISGALLVLVSPEIRKLGTG